LVFSFFSAAEDLGLFFFPQGEFLHPALEQSAPTFPTPSFEEIYVSPFFPPRAWLPIALVAISPLSFFLFSPFFVEEDDFLGEMPILPLGLFSVYFILPPPSASVARRWPPSGLLLAEKDNLFFSLIPMKLQFSHSHTRELVNPLSPSMK